MSSKRGGGDNDSEHSSLAADNSSDNESQESSGIDEAAEDDIVPMSLEINRTSYLSHKRESIRSVDSYTSNNYNIQSSSTVQDSTSNTSSISGGGYSRFTLGRKRGSTGGASSLLAVKTSLDSSASTGTATSAAASPTSPVSANAPMNHFRRASLVAFAFASSASSTGFEKSSNAISPSPTGKTETSGASSSNNNSQPQAGLLSRTKTWLRGGGSGSATKEDAAAAKFEDGLAGTAIKEEATLEDDVKLGMQTVERVDYSEYICPVLKPKLDLSDIVNNNGNNANNNSNSSSSDLYISLAKMRKSYLREFSTKV